MSKEKSITEKDLEKLQKELEEESNKLQKIEEDIKKFNDEAQKFRDYVKEKNNNLKKTRSQYIDDEITRFVNKHGYNKLVCSCEGERYNNIIQCLKHPSRYFKNSGCFWCNYTDCSKWRC